MQRVVIFMILMLASCQMWAQSDSVRVADMPSDSAYEQRAAQDEEAYYAPQYSSPRKNAISYFGSPFAEHFCDIKTMVGSDIGIGINYTYIPEVWGGNITAYNCFNSEWVLAGFNYRLSKPWNRCDWQLYGDLGFGHYDNPYLSFNYTPALEVGMRLGSSLDKHFGHRSVTLGVLTDLQNVYVTFGLSATLTFLTSLALLLGL